MSTICNFDLNETPNSDEDSTCEHNLYSQRGTSSQANGGNVFHNIDLNNPPSFDGNMGNNVFHSSFKLLVHLYKFCMG